MMMIFMHEHEVTVRGRSNSSDVYSSYFTLNQLPVPVPIHFLLTLESSTKKNGLGCSSCQGTE